MIRSVEVLAGVLLLCLSAGCATPLASRRAQVLEKREVEMVIVPAGVLAIDDQGRQLVVPHVEGSIRFGVFDDVDVQLKFDESLIPELVVGWQFVGDPRVNEFAMTITAGGKVGILPPWSTYSGSDALNGNLSLPFQLLIDLPVGEESALYFGTRTILGSSFGLSGTSVAVTPGLLVGLSLNLGGFILQPEVGVNAPVFLSGGSVGLDAAVFAAVGVGFGSRFRLGGENASPAAP